MNSKPKDRNQHIKVFARVRPRNAQETRSNIVVECVGNKDISVKDKGQTKNFAFDRVFGPESKQIEVYKAVVAPLINEVLQGYNCTVFAYGQTGTGKTFTMVGDRTKDISGGWENDPLCGIVPRTLDHLFDELKVRAEEYTVRVSFLELYNEELCDLLAPADNDDTKTLRLFEDSMKKGSVIVSGLEERTVYEKNDVYPILEAGSLRRQTAPTLMNASSSRSHTIFMITVHVKVTTPEGEDLFKTGKLNLVDLAGSENIGRSGAVDMRAREAGNINQSLLTLGRVITSLVERTPHVPYRESKLTRILQDSLGGRTKTSIIATVSPALCNLEETLSTFEYAHRARYITNKPEINQKTSKQVLLKNYTDEIERLRRDLIAAREKHGVYLQNEDYNGMLTQIDSLNKDLINKIQLLKVREDELSKQEDIMKSLNMNLYETKNDLTKNLEILKVKEEALKERETALQELNNQAQVLLRTADEATKDSKLLHDRLERTRMIQTQNVEVVDNFKTRFVDNLNGMKVVTQNFQIRSEDLTSSLLELNARGINHCRKHEDDINELLKKFLENLSRVDPEILGKVLNQVEPSITNLKKNENNVGFVGTSIESLSEQLSRFLQVWLDSRKSTWEHLDKNLSEDLEKQKQIAEHLENAKSSAEEVSLEMRNVPENLSTNLKIEEAAVNKLEAERNKILDEMDSIRNKREKLMKQELKAANALRAVDQKLAETRREAEKAILENVNVVTEKADDRLRSLAQMLSSIVEINSSLVKSAEDLSPKICQIQEGEKAEAQQIENLTVTGLKAITEQCSEIELSQRDEIVRLDQALIDGHKTMQEMKQDMVVLQHFAENLAKQENERLLEFETTLTAAHRQLAHAISEFCEQTFASIHDRCTDLKDHLKEELLRDEKTGFTPQRKEFHYPKRLVTVGKFGENQENLPPRLSHNLSDCGITDST